MNIPILYCSLKAKRLQRTNWVILVLHFGLSSFKFQQLLWVALCLFLPHLMSFCLTFFLSTFNDYRIYKRWPKGVQTIHRIKADRLLKRFLKTCQNLYEGLKRYNILIHFIFIYQDGPKEGMNCGCLFSVLFMFWKCKGVRLG